MLMLESEIFLMDLNPVSLPNPKLLEVDIELFTSL